MKNVSGTGNYPLTTLNFFLNKLAIIGEITCLAVVGKVGWTTLGFIFLKYKNHLST